MSRSTVVIELAGDAPFARDLAAGGVFVPGCALPLAAECDLVVCGANDQLRIPARVVYVEQQRGAGLELLGFSTEMKAQLAQLEPVPAAEPARADDADDDLAIPLARDAGPDEATGTGHPDDRTLRERAAVDDATPAGWTTDAASAGALAFSDDDLALAFDAVEAIDGGVVLDGIAARGHHDDELDARDHHDDEIDVDSDYQDDELDAASDHHDKDTTDDQPGAGEADAAPDDADPADDADDADHPSAAGMRRRSPRNVNERLRGLTLAAQIKLASQGELHERIVLERLYGKNVWETLLRNPRLTAPEVARIARYGSLPRVLLEIIVGNNAWLQIAEVRRALLSNPRLATDQIIKVLRLTPKHELKLAAIQTAYPHAVRNAAKMLLRSD